jgi:hypothetical protein
VRFDEVRLSPVIQYSCNTDDPENKAFRVSGPLALHSSGRIEGEQMTPTNKVEIYRLLYRLNRAFGFVVEQLQKLEPMKLIPPKDMKLFQANAQELQAEINDLMVENLQPLEMQDAHTFEKVRIAREKELRDPDDVFIHAEERRKELKRQELKKKRKQSKK